MSEQPYMLVHFIKKSQTEFEIIVAYVDNLKLVGTPEELIETAKYLKRGFEMKDLGKTKFCLDQRIEHFPTKGLVHQSTYIKITLKRFNMDKARSLRSLMVIQPIDVKNNSFCSCEKGENLLGPEVPYLSAIGSLKYLDNCIVYKLIFYQFISQVQFRSNLKTLEYLSAINALMYLDNCIAQILLFR